MPSDPTKDYEALTLRPERFIPGGETLVRIPDQPVTFVRGAVPGELVTATVTERKKQWRRAEVSEIIDPSPHRMTPPCPHVARGCGGCDWQYLEPGYQLEAKTQIAIDAIRRGVGSDFGFDPAAVRAAGRVSPTGYRTTIRVRGTDTGRSDAGRPGFYASGTHRVIDAPGCLVAHPGLHAVLNRLRIAKGVEVTLRISAATGQVTAIWKGPMDAVFGLGSEVAVGPDARLMENVAGVDLRVSAESFFQSGPEAASLLVQTVLRLAPEVTTAGHLVDAYGGVGLFAATLAGSGTEITLIESSASAVADARYNLQSWVDAGRATLWESAVENTAIWGASDTAVPVDLVIADPARQGLDRDGLSAVLATGTKVLVLVSCDPAAGARDLRFAVEAGCQLTAVEVLDLFPHTHHVEMVSRLEVPADLSSVRPTAP